MGRRIGADIRHVEIECHERTRLPLADGRHRAIIPAPEVLVEYRGRFMASLPEPLCDLYREVLIDLETPRAILHGQGNHALPCQLCRIGDGRLNGIAAERGIAVHNVLRSCCKTVWEVS